MTTLKVVAVGFFVIGFATSILVNFMLIFGVSETTRARTNRALISATNAMVVGIGIWLLFGLDRMP